MNEQVITIQKITGMLKRLGLPKHESGYRHSTGFDVRTPYREYPEIEVSYYGAYYNPQKAMKDVPAFVKALEEAGILFYCDFRNAAEPWKSMPEFVIPKKNSKAELATGKTGWRSRKIASWDEETFYEMMNALAEEKAKADAQALKEQQESARKQQERERQIIERGRSLNPSLVNGLGNSKMHIIECDPDGHSGMLMGELKVMWQWGEENFTATLHCMVTYQQQRSYSREDEWRDIFQVEVMYMFRDPRREEYRHNQLQTGRSTIQECRNVNEGMLYFAGDFRP